eukprot:8037631-Karenia_brevis.AAC.1
MDHLGLDGRGCGTGGLAQFQQALNSAGGEIKHTTLAGRRRAQCKEPRAELKLWRRKLKEAETPDERKVARRELRRHRNRVIKLRRGWKMEDLNTKPRRVPEAIMISGRP